MQRAPRITIQTLRVLSVMLETPAAEWYGLEISRRAALQTGTIYPILARLEAAGWLQSARENADPQVMGRPRRRLYRLTAEGERRAREVLADAGATLRVPAPAPVRLLPQPGGRAA